MNVCLVLDQHGNGTGSVESEPVYSSDAIDRGEFGATYHPVTGQKLKGLGLAFDNEHRCWRFEQPVTGGYGWGEEIPPDVKKLPRIGDSIAHPKSGFPLPRWNFDPYTGEKLRQ